MIHETAIVAGDAELGDGASVGPWSLVGLDPAGVADPIHIGPAATIRSHAVLYRGSMIGRGFHASHGALVRELTSIGDDVSIGSHTIVEHHVTIGSGARLHSNCFVPEHSVLHEGCWLGPGVIVTNARYPNRSDTKANLEGVEVGPGAVVGAGAVLLPGVRVGEASTVGAGAVVVADVAPGTTVVGNPARAL